MTQVTKELHETIEQVVHQTPGLPAAADAVRNSIHGAVLRGGAPTRRVADLLHGTWLGHPLHPVLTDITVGAWTLSTLFDWAGLLGRSKQMQDAGDALLSIGAASATATAITGLADYSTIPKRAAPVGLVHALLNVGAQMLNLFSLGARKKGNRSAGILASTLAFGGLMLSAYIGGDMVYRLKVGVRHGRDHRGEPENWMDVLPEGELVEHQPVVVEVAEVPVLLYRYGGTVYAIGAVCGHAGGPLQEGAFDGYCIECPWHQSVYDVRDGHVVHGPSTYAQPSYRARIEDGQVQIMAR